MSRTFETNNLVRLPILDAPAAEALGSAVMTAAANKTLPGPVADALAQVKVAVEALQEVAVQRMPNGDPVARAADINLDGAWASLYGLLGGWSRLPDHAHAELAATLRAQLFPDGMRFTRLPFRVEWVESGTRLRTIDERGFAAQIEQLGGSIALAQIRQAHDHYGAVLSITALPAEPGLGLRDARTAVTKALRLFVVRVIASINTQDPSSADLARDLLAPIESWEPIAPTKAVTPQPPPPAPTPTPTPAPVVTPVPLAGDPATGAGVAAAKASESAH